MTLSEHILNNNIGGHRAVSDGKHQAILKNVDFDISEVDIPIFSLSFFSFTIALLFTVGIFVLLSPSIFVRSTNKNDYNASKVRMCIIHLNGATHGSAA